MAFFFFLSHGSQDHTRRWADQEIGTAGHATTWTSKEGTHANAATSQEPVTDQATMEVLEGEEALLLDSALGLTLGLVTGTAASATAELTTSLAVPAASSVAPPRMILRVGLVKVATCLEWEASDLVAEAAAALAAPDGNPETGFAPGFFFFNLSIHAYICVCVGVY